MNRILICFHWLLSMGQVFLLWMLQGSVHHYNPRDHLLISSIALVIVLVLVTMMVIKNPNASLMHFVISFITLVATYKLFQIPFSNLYMTGLILGFTTIQVYCLQQKFYQQWGTWAYILVIYIGLPTYGMSRIFIHKPVLTTVFDNDLSVVLGFNPIYTGIGYLTAVMTDLNYLGQGPIVALGLLTLLLALPVFFTKKSSRKDLQHEKITT